MWNKSKTEQTSSEKCVWIIQRDKNLKHVAWATKEHLHRKHLKVLDLAHRSGLSCVWTILWCLASDQTVSVKLKVVNVIDDMHKLQVAWASRHGLCWRSTDELSDAFKATVVGAVKQTRHPSITVFLKTPQSVKHYGSSFASYCIHQMMYGASHLSSRLQKLRPLLLTWAESRNMNDYLSNVLWFRSWTSSKCPQTHQLPFPLCSLPMRDWYC